MSRCFTYHRGVERDVLSRHVDDSVLLCDLDSFNTPHLLFFKSDKCIKSET